MARADGPRQTGFPPPLSTMTLAQQGTQVALRGLNRLAQLDLIDKVGLQNYLQSVMGAVATA